MRQSAGTLLYREGPDGLEVLLVHPSGPYNRHAPWSIPKGEPSESEAADKDGLEAAARRETLEETDVCAGPLVALGFMDYKKSRKRVHCYAGPAPANAAPHTASWEVDQAAFVPMNKARELLHPDQAVFLDRLLAHLGKTPGTTQAEA